MIAKDYADLLVDARLRRRARSLDASDEVRGRLVRGMVAMRKAGVIVGVWCDRDRWRVQRHVDCGPVPITWEQVAALVDAFYAGERQDPDGPVIIAGKIVGDTSQTGPAMETDERVN